MLEIYQLAIDWAISNSPSTVDAIFRRAIMLTPPDVSSEIKCIRLRFARFYAFLKCSIISSIRRRGEVDNGRRGAGCSNSISR